MLCFPASLFSQQLQLSTEHYQANTMDIQLPPELVDIIITEFWYSEHSSSDRITFMTACPLINSVWRDVYARITSRDIYIPKVAYLLYLSSIICYDSDSPIYGHLPCDSPHTITCYVDLTHSTDDAAKDPYSVLCSLPNYLGFRRSFPNIERINLEMKFCHGWYQGWSHSRQLFRTRVSIQLNEATSQLSALPVEWSIAVYCPPDVKHDEYMPLSTQSFQRHILEGIAIDMVQCCHSLVGGVGPAMKGSTYHHGAQHFHNQICIEEKRGDVRSINFELGKALTTPLGWSESPPFISLLLKRVLLKLVSKISFSKFTTP
ncbi:uncharacterized protein EV420DRAFT_1562957 [Desarmillaria tabescens]|uniref:Uncharacterized protein n=1 Tax=Armillaria tabescens TaxID=1929756 RepID=A0AA39JZG7_ARMTA|nr:uncharacterized protein EV420DRAFT_1562957 [Desarmillaria tabescens]KAK0450324.1 hypothetical protein EV420DRAFT_1562957 [Desarmillaria tabescens]